MASLDRYDAGGALLRTLAQDCDDGDTAAALEQIASLSATALRVDDTEALATLTMIRILIERGRLGEVAAGIRELIRLREARET